MMAMLNAGSRVKKDLDVIVMEKYDVDCEYEDDGTPVCNWSGLTAAITLCQMTSFLVLLLFVWFLPSVFGGEDELEQEQEQEQEGANAETESEPKILFSDGDGVSVEIVDEDEE